MTRAESVALATEARKARIVTAAESRERLAFVEQLLVDDAAHGEIVRRCAERFRMSASAVERVKSRVFAAWAEQDAQRRDLRRAQQRRRLLRVIRSAGKARVWRAVVAAEALLAKIDDTLVTDRTREERLTAEDRERDPIWRVLRSLTPEELRDLAGEDREQANGTAN